MEISDKLVCLYSGQVEERGDSFVVEVPEDEITAGGVAPGGTYRIALLSGSEDDSNGDSRDRSGTDGRTERRSQSGRNQGPPVEAGDQRTVDIEDIGEQGDGIARVERGYVVIVPETEQGERVTIEITDVRENMGFADVVEREAYYE